MKCAIACCPVVLIQLLDSIADGISEFMTQPRVSAHPELETDTPVVGQRHNGLMSDDAWGALLDACHLFVISFGILLMSYGTHPSRVSVPH